MDCLLIEDEPQLAQLLQRRLTRAGFQVEWVTSVSTAVGALLQRPYAVVLLDIVLKQGRGRPDQYGLDVARAHFRAGANAVCQATRRLSHAHVLVWPDRQSWPSQGGDLAEGRGRCEVLR